MRGQGGSSTLQGSLQLIILHYSPSLLQLDVLSCLTFEHVHGEFIQVLFKKQDGQGKRTNLTFLQRRQTDGQQAHENMLSITNHQKTQIKTTLKYHLTLVRMTIIKSLQIINAREGVEKTGNILHCWWECKLVQPLWRKVWRFLFKKLKIELSYD